MSKQAERKHKRSGSCPCEICGKRRPLVSHHINGRDVPRADEHWNLVNLCSNCHEDVHNDGMIIIEGWMRTTEGRTLFWRRKGEDPVASDGAKPYNMKNPKGESK